MSFEVPPSKESEAATSGGSGEYDGASDRSVAHGGAEECRKQRLVRGCGDLDGHARRFAHRDGYTCQVTLQVRHRSFDRGGGRSSKVGRAHVRNGPVVERGSEHLETAAEPRDEQFRLDARLM